MQVKLHNPTFGEEEIAAVTEVMRSTMVTSGAKVKAFEQAFHPNAVMCNSGSSANLLAVAAVTNPVWGDALRPGDEVIVSALSWATTVWPLVQHGLVPVIVDIDPDTLNIDPDKTVDALGMRTRAIMPVHVYGNPCDMANLLDIADKADAWLIEDCCEALGATYEGHAVGTLGLFGTFSFYFSHHITTLEGGMVVTTSPKWADLVRCLRAHGWTREMDEPGAENAKHPDIDPRFLFVNSGYNLRATECQGAMGLIQLSKLAGFVEKRRAAAAMYNERFGRHRRWLRTQKETPGGKSSWFSYAIVVEPDAPFSAADLRQHFEAAGIETRAIICGNIAAQPAMKLYPHRVPFTLPHADHVMRAGFSIGCHQDVDSAACAYVGDTLDEFMRARGCD